MMRRAAFVFAALTVGVLLAAPPAGAQSSAPGKGSDDDYTSACSALALSSTQVHPGDTITVSGSAANAGPVTIKLDNVVLATTTAAPFTHAFSTTITIPAGTAVGNHTVQAVQAAAGCTAQIASLNILGLTVEAPRAEPAAPLARTGSNSTLPLIRFGFGLLAAGGVAIFVSRRRKASVSAGA